MIDFNFETAPDKFRQIGNALGADIPFSAPPDEIKDTTLSAFRNLKQAAGVKVNLCELGMTQKDLPALAEKALADACMLTNPRQPTADEVIKIYEAAC